MLKKRNPGVFPLWLVLFEKPLLHRQKGFNTQCIFNIRLSSNYQMSGNLPYDWNLTPGILKNPFTFFKLFFAQNLWNCILRCIFTTSSLDFTVKARNPPTPTNSSTKSISKNWKMRRRVHILSTDTLFWSLELTEPKNIFSCCLWACSGAILLHRFRYS